MASTYDVGDQIRISATFVTTGGTTDDPTTIRFLYQTPDGTVNAETYSTSTGSIVRDSSGNYHRDVGATGRGVYWTRFESTGTIVSAEEHSFIVRTQQVSTA